MSFDVMRELGILPDEIELSAEYLETFSADDEAELRQLGASAALVARVREIAKRRPAPALRLELREEIISALE